MIFKSIPPITNAVFKLRAYGGVYDGIVGKKQIYKGCGLNNCTCGAWGLMALYQDNLNCKIGCGARSKNQPYDAGQWYYLNDDEYVKSNIPVEGSIICYTNHVAFVNEVKESGDIVVLESGYGSTNNSGLWKFPLYKVNNILLLWKYTEKALIFCCFCREMTSFIGNIVFHTLEDSIKIRKQKGLRTAEKFFEKFQKNS